MKLTYRGVSYDYTPNPVPQMKSVGKGVYRGVKVAFQALTETPAQPSAVLMWRGIPYRQGTAAASTSAPAAPAMATVAAAIAEAKPNIDVSALARSLFIRHHQRSRKREQGMMVRLAAEVGLPVDEAARYASQVQGKLPHDFSAYDRSSTAMS